VSRWMTWLPNSLKNAANCDKWYQLQNLSITESLNANGAQEKHFVCQPWACRISQCRQSKPRTQGFFDRRGSPSCPSFLATTFSFVGVFLLFRERDCLCLGLVSFSFSLLVKKEE